jgi:hypothetical protein
MKMLLPIYNGISMMFSDENAPTHLERYFYDEKYRSKWVGAFSSDNIREIPF